VADWAIARKRDPVRLGDSLGSLACAALPLMPRSRYISIAPWTTSESRSRS
jgi:hypothetical protein